MTFIVSRETEPDGGTYRAIAEDGRAAGHMTYRAQAKKTIVIDTTKVNDDFSGQGVGALLIERAVADARDESIKIVPACAFVRHYFEKHADTLAGIRAT